MQKKIWVLSIISKSGDNYGPFLFEEKPKSNQELLMFLQNHLPPDEYNTFDSKRDTNWVQSSLYLNQTKQEFKTQYCEALDTWFDLYLQKLEKEDEPSYLNFVRSGIDIAIQKSCLLDRMINCGEGLSQTPCPVHKGKWVSWSLARKLHN